MNKKHIMYNNEFQYAALLRCEVNHLKGAFNGSITCADLVKILGLMSF